MLVFQFVHFSETWLPNFNDVLLLHEYTGGGRENYQQMFAKRGSYILRITSLDSDSYVKILPKVQPIVRLSSNYPALPLDHTVKAKLRKNSVTAHWTEAATANGHWFRSVEYCVVISRIKNFGTHCAALSHLNGDPRPKISSWGFSKNHPFAVSKKRPKPRPLRKASSNLIIHACVGNKTSYTHVKLKRGKTYFIDVFVIDKKSNTSSSYTGTTVSIPKKKKKSTVNLTIGETKTINLKRKKSISFKLTKTIPKLSIELIPCTGKLYFEIIHNRKKIKRKTLVRRWRSQILKNALPGSYRVTFPGKRRKRSYVTIFLSDSPARSKLVLPKKDNIHVFDKLTTCSSVTIAWMGTSNQQTYCLYKKHIGEKSTESRRDRCLSAVERPEGEKDLCIGHSSLVQRQVMERNVTGLVPGSWYRFHVYVTQPGTSARPLKSIKVKTLQQCT